MVSLYGTRQKFESQCTECAWWEGLESGESDDPALVEQAKPCTNPLAVNGMPPLLSAHEECPGFEPRHYPDYSEGDGQDLLWGSSSEILDLATAIDLIEEGRIERPGNQACANLPFQTVTAEGITFLSQYEYHSIGLGVTHLTRPVSEVLSKWGISVIRFLNPVALDTDGFEPFRFSDIEFYFWGGITGLNADVARILATCTGSLMLPDITITDEVAEALSTCKADASLSLLGKHSHEALRHLAQYQGERLLLTFDAPLDKFGMDTLCSNPKRSVERLEREDCESFQVLSVLK